MCRAQNNFISYDDQYNPPKTVEQVRRLMKEDKVAQDEVERVRL